ncbi:AraC family transcriptional regulator [Pseudomonas prosekii]|uniref:AraC family transcriptional regulator n=1 Tax=Pseudomonas prosekii TaxID=1148509 RepID=UPI00387B00A9
MVQLICSEFDEFEEALYGVQGRYVLRTRQQRDWQLNVVDLNGVALMSGSEGAGTVYTGIGLPGYFNIFVPLTAHESTVVDGHAFNRRRVGWMVPNAMFHINAKSPASWLTVAMSCELVLRWAAIREDEFDFSLLHRNLVSNAQRHLGPLLWLARRLFHIDAHAPQALHTDAAEQAARTEVMDVVFRLLLPVDPVHAAPRHNRDHKDILRRALELLDTLDIQSVYTEDICQATCASERTVRNVFNEYLGMSPHRYLMIRRLHAIRAAIRHAGPEDTITHICARFGVWDFGRFASLYRQYFGTLPAQSLKAAKALSHL